MINQLNQIKISKINDVNAKTEWLLSKGYYSASDSITISMDKQSRVDYCLFDEYSAVSNYPYVISDVNGVDYISFANHGLLTAFMTSANAFMCDVMESGATLIKSILDCTTESQVNAIVDNRKWSDFYE